MSSNPPNHQNFSAYPSAPPYESPDCTPSPPSQPQESYPPAYPSAPPYESPDCTPSPPSQPQESYPPPPPSQPQQYYPPPPPSQPRYYSAPPPSQLQQYYPPPPPSQPHQFYPPPPPSQPHQFYPPPPPSQPHQFYPPPPLSAPYGSQPICGIPVYKGSTSVDWSTGLFDCFDDIPSCIVTGFCPCITFGQIAEIVDKGDTSCVVSAVIYSCIAYFLLVPCVYSSLYRSKLRNQYRLHELPCADCPVHFFFECCALCQEYRELKNRGFDMSVGWDGNAEKQRREMTMPPMAQGMTR